MNNENMKFAESMSDRNRGKYVQTIIAMVFSITLFTGIIVCIICDGAISGRFTWSLYPVSSIVFTWLVFFPVINYGKKGVLVTLISFSIFLIPFLYVLDRLIDSGGMLFPIAVRVSFAALLYIWVVYALFKALRKRKLVAAAVSLLLVIPESLFINLILFYMISEPFMDIWDILSFLVAAMCAAQLFIIDAKKRGWSRIAEKT